MRFVEMSRRVIFVSFILYLSSWGKDFSPTRILNITEPSAPQTTTAPYYINSHDETCAAAWWAWQDRWWSLYTSADRKDLLDGPPSAFTRTQIFASASSYTECDGIPRVSYLVTASTTRTLTYYDVRNDTYHQHVPIVASAKKALAVRLQDVLPFPECALNGPVCEWNWNKLFEKSQAALHLMPRFLNHTNMFGCPPPRARCEILGKCILSSPEFKLIFVEPESLASTDLCASDGYGASSSHDQRKGSLAENVTLSAITFWNTETFLDSITHVTATEIIPGPHTFAPGKVYLAYRGLGGGDFCDWFGPMTTDYVSGVMEIPFTDLSTLRLAPKSQFWNGSEIDLAKSIAAQKIVLGTLLDADFETITRPLTLAHLVGPVPVTEYFFGQLSRGPRGGPGRITIRDDKYRFAMPIPTKLLDLYPAWSACSKATESGWDPVLVLPGAARAPRPSAPAWARGDSVQTDSATSPEMTLSNNARPGANLAVASATTARIRPSDEAVQSTTRQILKWQGPQIAATATSVQAVPVLGKPDMIIVGSNILISDGPQFDMNGETVLFGAHGLVIGSRTLTASRAASSDRVTDPIVFSESRGTASHSAFDNSDMPLSADDNPVKAAIDYNTVQPDPTQRSTTGLHTGPIERIENTVPLGLVASATTKSESPSPARSFMSPFIALGLLLYYLTKSL